MKSTDPLKGKVFVFTGEMKMSRDDAKQKVIELGGRSTLTISGKTSYLVTGTEPGQSKLGKAKEKKVAILTEDEFVELIRKYKNLFSSSIEIGEIENIPSDFSTEENESKKTSEIHRIKNTIEKRIFKNSSTVEAVNDLLWAEKYRPRKKEELIGNPSSIKQLLNFLEKDIEDCDKKAALLSGHPGVGKTTSVYVLCKELNIDLIEFNASDCRNKALLCSTIKYQTQAKGLYKNKKKVLLMDEIDGMSSDRGGLAELVSIIKKTNIHIVCTCNDRQNQKIRTLANYCLDIRFRKLDARSILPKINEILRFEKVFLPESIINKIIFVCNSDMRFILNTLQSNRKKRSVKDLTISEKKEETNVFATFADLCKTTQALNKLEYFFEDYSIIPLFVYENYCKSRNTSRFSHAKDSYPSLRYLAYSSDSISKGDLLDSSIHGSSLNFSLLPYFGVLSTLIPSLGMKGSRIDFPGYLGQNSTRNANIGLLDRLSAHLKYNVKGFEARKYYFPLILKYFKHFMGRYKVDKVIELLIESNLLKSDLDAIAKIMNRTSDIKEIPSKQKSLLTREYKKIKRTLPFDFTHDIDDE